MKLLQYDPAHTDREAKDVAYWERNMLALKYADGWYNDDIEVEQFIEDRNDVYIMVGGLLMEPRFKGWRRVLSLEGGSITFHIPDDFDVGNLPQIERNWDGHTTVEKWKRIAEDFLIILEE